ncbi:MAG: rhomboid family intramembrane serine protease [Longimicrobiaceae bacterium]
MAYEPSFGNPFGFRVTPWVKRLLIANAVFFLVTWAFRGLLPYLVFTPAEILTSPWTPITYQFVHAGLLHLLINMLILFFFGPPLEERWGSGEFIKFYLVSGLGGAALSVLFPTTPILGASGAVYGVMLAYALYWPENPIYIWGVFPVKAKWWVAFLAGMSVFYLISGTATGIAHLAHLGGFAAAYLYLKSDWGPSPWGGSKRPRREKPSPPRRADPLGAVGASSARQQRTREQESKLLDDVDRILDKISSSGLDSLTESERKRLEEVSKRYRTS